MISVTFNELGTHPYYCCTSLLLLQRLISYTWKLTIDADLGKLYVLFSKPWNGSSTNWTILLISLKDKSRWAPHDSKHVYVQLYQLSFYNYTKQKGHITHNFTIILFNKFHKLVTMKIEKTCKVQNLILTIL
jgi:hypothetical protein